MHTSINNEPTEQCQANLGGSKRDFIDLSQMDKTTFVQVDRFGRIGNTLFPLAELIRSCVDYVTYFYSLDRKRDKKEILKIINNELRLVNTFLCKEIFDEQSAITDLYYSKTDKYKDISKHVQCFNNDFSSDVCDRNVKHLLCTQKDCKGHPHSSDSCAVHVVCMMDGGVYFVIYIHCDNRTCNSNKFEYISELLSKPEALHIIKYNQQNVTDESNINKDELTPITSNIGTLYLNTGNKKLIYLEQQRFSHLYTTYLDGNYFQSYKYFIRDLLFDTNDNYKTYSELLKKHYNGITIVSAHIRADDFGIGSNWVFYILYYTYYLDCIKDILTKVKGNIVILFNFHPNDYKIYQFYKRRILQHLNNNRVSIVCEKDIPDYDEYKTIFSSELQHIRFMSCFDYIILSNSSYSFWSGFISKKTSSIYMPLIYQLEFGGNRFEPVTIYNKNYKETNYGRDAVMKIPIDRVLAINLDGTHDSYVEILYLLKKNQQLDFKSKTHIDKVATMRTIMKEIDFDGVDDMYQTCLPPSYAVNTVTTVTEVKKGNYMGFLCCLLIICIILTFVLKKIEN